MFEASPCPDIAVHGPEPSFTRCRYLLFGPKRDADTPRMRMFTLRHLPPLRELISCAFAWTDLAQSDGLN